MKKQLEQSFEDYKKHMGENVPDYSNIEGRKIQCQDLINVINDRFSFDEIITLETGASQNYADGLFGLFLGYFTEKLNGTMITVDIDEIKLKKNEDIFKKELPSLKHTIITSDSVSLLKNWSFNPPNLVHLDSWDFDLLNPFPSALHGWREFEAIESKMESGSIIIIDDNFLFGTSLQWILPDGSFTWNPINYPIIGKGTHIYQYVLSGQSDWELLYPKENPYKNTKVIIQKK